MHLFGCKFCWIDKHSETECDRANFDSLLWAIVTVFQILTQEDWNLVLYNGMASSGPLASLYFIALMTIGNYVLFNLSLLISIIFFLRLFFLNLLKGWFLQNCFSQSWSDSVHLNQNCRIWMILELSFWNCQYL